MKIISGAQTGADEAGLHVARLFGLKTGGTMPKGFRTLSGPRPDLASLYGLAEHTSADYVPRTYQNVRDADATVRLAGNFLSRGEICTMRAIESYSKPHFDVDLGDPRPPAEFAKWLTDHNVEVLNVAGNSEQTFSGAFRKSSAYLTETFFCLGFHITVTADQILEALNLSGRRLFQTGDHCLVGVDRLFVC